VTLLSLGIIGVAFTQVVTTATETALKDEQEENRRALFDHAGNQLRNWATIALTIVAALFTALREARKFLQEIFGKKYGYLILVFLVCLLSSQFLYSVTRIVWYTRFSAAVLEAPEGPSSSLYLLKESVDNLTEDKLAKALPPCLAHWICWIGSDLWGWILFSAEATTIVFSVLFLVIFKRKVRPWNDNCHPRC